ncbi:helicase/primase complex associated protein UL8 [Leporid alphaherpesvirus 4]|uniref:Helicase/primase complex associated protein UL8 n=1 Tax=Leporid alphaherpesvirus 4 TaxID=481315 RepID=J9QWK2_9ALPH|nr:helicase/primase complex associated protein UL8 [Leporid alphaherpesvirus 4]AFR32449.1 helicase/primase complex associated protein UL8 [Leporid alphaherpesvirus 4]
MESDSLRQAQCIAGSIRAVSLYTAWTQPGHRHRLRALVCLIVLPENGLRECPLFALISISEEELKARSPGANWSPQSLASAVRSASSPRTAPLETLRNPSMWRVLASCALASLEREVGAVQLFRPARLWVDERNGLLRRVDVVGDDILAPRAALLSIDARVPIDKGALSAQAASRPDACAAWLRLAAMQQEPEAALDAHMRVRITAPGGTFVRSYTTLRFPPVESEGAISDVFSVHTASVLLGPDGTATKVCVAVPSGFDYFACDTSAVSTPAIVSLFAQWHCAVFAHCARTAQVFAFLGTEFEPRGGEDDHLMTIGFPGWPTIRLPADATSDERKRIIDTYIHSEGAWPALREHAFPPPSVWAQASAYMLHKAPPDIRGVVDRWTPGRTSARFLDAPDAMGPVAAARFLIPHLAGLVLAALLQSYPPAAQDSGAARFIRFARFAREHRWADRAIGAAASAVSGACAEAARAAGGLLAAVELCIEQSATEAGVAVCGRGEDNFWGLFAAAEGDLRAASSAVAAEFARAATRALEESGLRLPRPVDVTCGGVYTHVVLWNPAGGWFGGAGDDFLEGFSPSSRAGARAADVLRATFRRLIDTENPDAARSIIREACDAFVVEAFAARGDAEYWSVAMAPSAAPLPASALSDGDALDAERHTRRVVYVKTHDGGSVGVPIDLYRKPLVLPPIDCARHVKDVIADVIVAMCAFVRGRWGDEVAFEYSPDDGPLFMFR